MLGLKLKCWICYYDVFWARTIRSNTWNYSWNNFFFKINLMFWAVKNYWEFCCFQLLINLFLSIVISIFIGIMPLTELRVFSVLMFVWELILETSKAQIGLCQFVFYFGGCRRSPLTYKYMKWSKLQGVSRLVASGMRLLQAGFWTSEVPKGFFGLPRTGVNYI